MVRFTVLGLFWVVLLSGSRFVRAVFVRCLPCPLFRRFLFSAVPKTGHDLVGISGRRRCHRYCSLSCPRSTSSFREEVELAVPVTVLPALEESFLSALAMLSMSVAAQQSGHAPSPADFLEGMLVTTSRGQKARIGVARAMYSRWRCLSWLTCSFQLNGLVTVGVRLRPSIVLPL